MYFVQNKILKCIIPLYSLYLCASNRFLLTIIYLQSLVNICKNIFIHNIFSVIMTKNIQATDWVCWGSICDGGTHLHCRDFGAQVLKITDDLDPHRFVL